MFPLQSRPFKALRGPNRIRVPVPMHLLKISRRVQCLSKGEPLLPTQKCFMSHGLSPRARWKVCQGRASQGNHIVCLAGKGVLENCHQAYWKIVFRVIFLVLTLITKACCRGPECRNKLFRNEKGPGFNSGLHHPNRLCPNDPRYMLVHMAT